MHLRRGDFCEEEYREMLEAYGRLCDRLGVVDEDSDVEQIVDSLLAIQRVLCMEMFRLGAESAKI